MPDMTMADFLAKAKTGRFLTVSFIKRGDGSERVMNCRTGVTKGTKGGSIGYKPQEHRLLSVYDVKVRGFRMVNLEELLTASIGGRHYVWDRHKGVFVERERAR